MRAARERGVPAREHLLEGAPLDWQSLRLFLELHRAGSFRAAATRLGLSVNSMRRRLEDLEAVFGVPLFTRHFDGLRPTQEGVRVLGGAEAMELAALDLLRARSAPGDEIEGSVRVAVTEGLGAIWLTPRLLELQARHNRLRIDLNCGETSADVLRMEADLSVQLTRPQAPDLKVVRLGYLHSMPFASPAYIAQYGAPTRIDDLADHRVVLQLAEQTAQGPIFAETVAGLSKVPTVSFTTNTSSAHALAVANGVGIGWLPTYVHALHPGMVPIDCGVEFTFDIWLTYHPDVEALPRVRRTIDWIRSIFDARAFPFFAEEKVHPRDLPRIDHHMSLVDWYERFAPMREPGMQTSQDPDSWQTGSLSQ